MGNKIYTEKIYGMIKVLWKDGTIIKVTDAQPGFPRAQTPARYTSIKISQELKNI